MIRRGRPFGYLVVVRLMCVIVQYIIVSTLRSIRTRHK